ncbi:MAG TPA: UDP-N-acetylmuramoyl-L-alanyl-D-glutamate--2,6-diaminopimelate ligase, partial [Planctomycetota bacterium]|nr:UDP-N-acetylmuramoyl-L-alanyl-D-glutamate--2,6-diaminopimelate ligase [Planctomycetota bacterium]
TELTPFLAAAVARGAGAATMEASSHALAQDRLAGLRFDVAAFTNLSRDHLDYHRTFEEYFAAKARLFDLLKPGGRAVINADDSYGRRLIERLPPDVVLATSLDGRAACELSAEAEFGERGVVLRCRRASTGERFDIRSPLLGRPNAENLLTAAAAALAGGLAAKDVADALGAVSRVPGRLEPVPCGRGFSVLVDYAHKPAALEGVLKTVRALAARSGGRVLVVFGCGGDRDRGKRPEMGAIAARLADLVFVTSDNPRSEAPEAILADIRAGVEAARGAARYDVDRRAAVATALSEARPGDVVLIAGKGHETSQTIGGVSHPFDDRKVARELLAAAGDAVAAAAASGGAAPA